MKRNDTAPSEAQPIVQARPKTIDECKAALAEIARQDVGPRRGLLESELNGLSHRAVLGDIEAAERLREINQELAGMAAREDTLKRARDYVEAELKEAQARENAERERVRLDKLGAKMSEVKVTAQRIDTLIRDLSRECRVMKAVCIEARQLGGDDPFLGRFGRNSVALNCSLKYYGLHEFFAFPVIGLKGNLSEQFGLEAPERDPNQEL